MLVSEFRIQNNSVQGLKNTLPEKKKLPSFQSAITDNNFDMSYRDYNIDISKINDYQKSLDYISTTSENLRKKGIALDSFEYLDRDKLNGITYGLKTYQNMSDRDLPLFYNTVGNAMQVGCHNNCYHCFVKAPKIAGEYNNSITLLNWEDFLQYCTDTKELNSRLGFNLYGKDFGKFYTILDSDPISLKMPDKSGNVHNVAEAAEQIYDNLGLSYVFSTAGWEKDDDYAVKTAKDICSTVKNRPEVFDKVEVSIHPFQEKMKKANDNYYNYIKFRDVDTEESENFYEKYLNEKDSYVDRMAHVLKEFLPIMNTGKFSIEPQFAITSKTYPYSKEQAESVCVEILERLEQLCDEEGTDSSIITSQKNIDQNPFFHSWREITSIGRNKDFSDIKFPSLFSLEKNNDANNLVIEPFGSGNFFGDQVVDSVVKSHQKGVKLFDNIIVNVDLENGMDALLFKNNLLDEIDAKERTNLKLDSLLQKLSGVNDVSLRFVYDSKDKAKKIFADSLKGDLVSKYAIKKIIHAEADSLDRKTDAVGDFKEILNNLSDEQSYEFVKHLAKYIDVNGRLGFLTYNYPLFGYGSAKDRMIYLNDIKMNDNRRETTIR